MTFKETGSVRTYQELMPYRVKEILIVSSAYDAFIMEEDGGLMEHIYLSYRGVSLVGPPRFTLVTHTDEAFTMMKRKKFDLVVIMPRYLEVDLVSFGRMAKILTPDIPVVFLSHNTKGVVEHARTLPKDSIDKVFIWSGNRNILWAIVKWVEDRINVIHDTETAMVRVVILIEDSPYYYSSLLPLLYEVVVQQTQDVLDDGLNEEHRLLKLRARPKILLAETYEEGIDFFTKFRPYVIGIFSDIRYPRHGKIDPEAGIHFLKTVKNKTPYLPLLLFSSEQDNRKKAEEVGAHFLDKNSPSLHVDIRRFFRDCLGFGDFIFRLPSGDEVARAKNLASMERILKDVPDESLIYHASIGHSFSNWFMARSQIKLASRIRAVKYSSFTDVEDIRQFLMKHIRETRAFQRRGIVEGFSAVDFEPDSEFLKIGNGSMGGKARGLAFMAKCLQRNGEKFAKFTNINIMIPKSLVITTDLFDNFIQENRLEDFVKIDCSDDVMATRFLEAKLPDQLESDLRAYLEKVRYPLAVRSSSLLEDGQFLSYAGLYKTYMLPNNHPDLEERYRYLARAIKLIYASVFYRDPKAFSKATMHRTEEEKMAISIQELKGTQNGTYFYPTLSGTVQSHNFYPMGPMKPGDGSAQIALGLGKTVVEGGRAIRFSPKFPEFLPQFSNVDQTLKNAQRFFYALKVDQDPPNVNELWIDDDVNLVKREVWDAREEEPVKLVSSIYIPQDHSIRDSQIAKGIPVVTFANILKLNQVPLAEILQLLTSIGKDGLGCDIEMEFAVIVRSGVNAVHDFILLQIRPLTTPEENVSIEISEEEKERSICYSSNAIGRNLREKIYDVIYVKPDRFKVTETLDMVREISELNSILLKEKRPYLLVGPGRWGSSDRMLGIPVNWNDISGVAGIVETNLENFHVEPSQGTHFFQNITSLGVLYFTIYNENDRIDWNWFTSMKPVNELNHICHLRLDLPLEVVLDSCSRQGLISRGISGDCTHP